MFISASSINQVFELCQKEFLYEEVLKKYFSKKSERDEFRQELWLTLLQKDQEEITSLWNRHEFKYYYIAIVNTWVKSSSSNWHNNFRKNKEQLFDYAPEVINEDDDEMDDMFKDEQQLEEEQTKRTKIKKINQVQEALNYYEKKDPLFKFESEVFKMYYFDSLSIRQIKKKLQDIPTTTIWRAIQYATILIKFHINKTNTNK